MGVTVEQTTPGDGVTFPKDDKTVTIHYTGNLTEDGKTAFKKFESSRDRGNPFKFKIGTRQVIKGWDEGIKQMSVGEHVKLTISPDYAYGSKGFPGVIPPNATLIFDVELIAIE